MTTEAGTPFESGAPLSLPSSAARDRAPQPDEGGHVERLHAYFLEGCPDEVRPALDDVYKEACRVRSGCGDLDVGDNLASVAYAASAVVELAAALELDDADVRGAAAAVAEACALPLSAARFVFFSEAARNPRMLELPPLMAVEILLNLLLGLDVATEISLWRQSSKGLDCLLSFGGAGEPSRRIRAEAKAVMRGRSRLSLLGGSQLRSGPVLRFGEPYAAVVARCGSLETDVADAFIAEAATALGPILERENLLEHSAERDRTLVACCRAQAHAARLRPPRRPDPGDPRARG